MSNQVLLTFLLNASWQVALIAIVALFGDWLLREASARHRHFLWVAALALSLALPVLTSLHRMKESLDDGRPLLQRVAEQNGRSSMLLPHSITSGTTTSVPSISPQKVTGALIPVNREIAAVLAALYLLFLCYRGLKLFRAWHRTRVLVRGAVAVNLSAFTQAAVKRCQTAIGLASIDIRYSATIPVPMTVGSFKPLIILPEILLQEADADLLTSAIGHEVVHIKRRDYLLNLIYELISLPLSFHPAIALVRRRINQTRELGCDELVTERLLDAKVYARSLVRLAGAAIPGCRAATTITVGIADADILEERIMKMLKRSKINIGRKRWLLVAASLCLAAPCMAAAPFALRVNINQQGLALRLPETVAAPLPVSATLQQVAATKAITKPLSAKAGQDQDKEREQELFEKAKKILAEAEARHLAELLKQAEALSVALSVPELDEKRETLELLMKELEVSSERARAVRASQDPDLMAKRQAEREAKAKDRAELVKQSNITMQQAIQIATAKQPGTVLESRLLREWNQVCYVIGIISGDGTSTGVVVSAVDGSIIKVFKDERER